MINKLREKINRVVRFLSYDIWRINRDDMSSSKFNIYNIVKTFILTYRTIDAGGLNTRASALTYSTLLSIVPLLAVLFAIARGFGFQNILQSQLFSYFEGQQKILEKAFIFVDKSLEYAASEVFVGIGVVLLLYTVINLLSGIETNFNAVWRIKSSRSYYRQFTDYIALFLVIPIFILCNAGAVLLFNTSIQDYIFDPVVDTIMVIAPFVITILLFTFLYIYMPNTKVKFSSALFGGFFAGIAFQSFQIIYINGQIWISKYNTIYGSFAALPLLLLWLQLSWFICLIGVQLAFSYQNIGRFSFEKETETISRRYRDFLILLISSLIIKRFEKGEEPYTADKLSDTYEIPTQLTNDILYYLCQVGIIVPTSTHEDMVSAYVPGIDINKITVDYLFEKVDLYGSEDFKIDTENLFKHEWEVIENLRRTSADKDTLVKDL